MSSKIALHNGTATGVYDDRWRPIFETLGTLQVQRASEVEFDAKTGEWVATHIATGQVIGRGRVRSEVVAQEVRWLEAHDLHPVHKPDQSDHIETNGLARVHSAGEAPKIKEQ